MKSSVLCLLLAFAAAHALARERAIEGSTSPDKRFYVAVEEVDAHIYYRIKSTATGKNQIAFLSEYQPDSGELEDWSFRHSLAAEIWWRDDSRCIAIDETNHRQIGTVIPCSPRAGKASPHLH